MSVLYKFVLQEVLILNVTILKVSVLEESILQVFVFQVTVLLVSVLQVSSCRCPFSRCSSSSRPCSRCLSSRWYSPSRCPSSRYHPPVVQLQVPFCRCDRLGIILQVVSDRYALGARSPAIVHSSQMLSSHCFIR